MLIGARTGAWVKSGGEPTIPYQRIAYISTGGLSAYIGLGRNFEQEGHVLTQQITVRLISAGRNAVCGSNKALYLAPNADNNNYWGAAWNDYENRFAVDHNNFQTITHQCDCRNSMRTWTLGMDGDSYQFTDSGSFGNLPIGVFTYGTGDNQYLIQYYSALCSDYKFWYDGELIYDLVSVRNGNVGGMYDKVSRDFHASNGSAQFVKGPDIN